MKSISNIHMHTNRSRPEDEGRLVGLPNISEFPLFAPDADFLDGGKQL